MNNVNVRGTFLCSKACIPYLKNAENPHILNVTPPLNIRHAWFKEHVAYSLSKYGMSLCVLGMSQEFKDDGIAVNALWPKKGIATVAVMVTAGKQGLAYCRIDKFFADAAYIMLTRDSKTRTGEFLYDEDVLKEAGITDFEQYSYIPAGAPVPDSFIDGYSPTLQRNSSKDTRETSSHRSQVRGVVDIFDAVENFLDEKLVQKVNAVFEFHLTGNEAGVWYLDLKSSTGEVGRGSFSGDEVNSTVMLDSEDFVKLFTGELNPAQAYLGGKLQLTGSMHKFMKLENQLLQKMKSKL